MQLYSPVWGTAQCYTFISIITDAFKTWIDWLIYCFSLWCLSQIICNTIYFLTKLQSKLTINVFFSSQNQTILLLNVLGFTGSRISGLHSTPQWKELHLHCPTAGSAQRDSLTLPGEREEDSQWFKVQDIHHLHPFCIQWHWFIKQVHPMTS